jgi:uncharacterized glyoxalase superfamily protein PhnB
MFSSERQFKGTARINDADAPFAQCRDNGGVIEYEPCIQDEYDVKVFAVRDPDGHVIAFGQHHKA